MSNAVRLEKTVIVTSSSDLIFVLEFCSVKKQLYFFG